MITDRPDRSEPPSRASGRGRPRSALVWLIRGLLTALVTVLILKAVGVRLGDIREISVDPAAIRPSQLGVSTLLLFLAFVASALLWRGLVRALGGPSVGSTSAVGITLVANLGRYLPGKVFQLLGLAWLGKRAGVPAGVATGAAVLGQVLHLVAAALVGGALLGATGVFPDAWRYAPLAAGGLMTVLVCWPGMAHGLLGLADRLRRPSDEATTVHAPRTLLPWALGYTANWLLLGLAFQSLSSGLGIPLSFGLAVSAFAAAYLLGYLAFFAPAGLGVREGFLVAFLGPALGPGPAVALATAQRVWMTAVEALGAAVAWPVLRTAGSREGQGRPT